ncbi:MAG TPA: choice-of-anchor Q domain-containing protein, partial [Clostridia bacterium]|nr:choice-of-anchor Q domain-containing protein [Clostridia bacterium]
NSGLSSTNPKLVALAMNSGPTPTMALEEGSPARDRIPPGNLPATDQRGIARPQNGLGDIGAYEYDLFPPVIVQQPVDQTVPLSSNATFSVSAASGSSIGYQWRFNGNQITGATLSSLTRTSVQATNAGAYDVVVANSFGSVTSQVATLTVTFPISGWVYNGSNGLSGIIVKIGTQETTTDTNGNYRLYLPPGTYTVAPVSTNYLFKPATLQVTVPPAASKVNFERTSPFTISQTTNGFFQLSFVGNAGQPLRIEASTNLTTWESIATNTAPLLFIDSTTNLPQRFYRLRE